MAAGADQQLIAAKLQESHEIGVTPLANTAEQTTMSETNSAQDSSGSTLPPDANLSIDHTATTNPTGAVNDTAPVESTLPSETSVTSTIAPDTPDVAPISSEPVKPTPDVASGASTLAPSSVDLTEVKSASSTIEPALGGTLNATTEMAADDARTQAEDNQNKTILTHSYLDPQASNVAPINGATEAVNENKPVDIFAGPVNPVEPSTQATSPPVMGESARDHDDARAAVDAALGVSSTPAPTTTPFDLPPPPPLPDFSTLPPMPPDFSAPQPSTVATQPERLGDIFAPQPAAVQPIVPSTLPPQPVASVANDPSQFHIPGSN